MVSGWLGEFFYFFSSLNIAAGSFKLKGKTDESEGIVLVSAIKKSKMAVSISQVPSSMHTCTFPSSTFLLRTKDQACSL